MEPSRTRNPPPHKTRGKRNISSKTEESRNHTEEISRLVQAGKYHISAIELGRRMLAYYSSRDS